MTTAFAIVVGATLFFAIHVVECLTKLRRMPKARREYCVQFRLKGTDDAWTVINWSVGTHRRAREALKSMLRDWTYRQYEYRVATRLTTDWSAK